MNSNPYKDDDEHEELIVAGNPIITILAFLWFQRRFIIGAVLLAVVGVIIYKVAMIPPKTFDDDEVTSLIINPPSASIDFKSFGQSSDTSDTNNASAPKIMTMENIVLPETKEIVPFDPLLKSGTVSELIGTSLQLRKDWIGKPMHIAFLMCQRRVQIDRRLMELELTESQQHFALGDYVETIICLDKIASDHKLQTPQIRDAMNEIADKYIGHPDPVVCAKANLAVLSVPLHDFYHDNKTEHLEVFSQLVPKHIEKIFADLGSTQRLTGLMMASHRQRNWDGSVVAYCVDVSQRMEKSDDAIIKAEGSGLRERIFFKHLEPNGIVDRMKFGDDESRSDVKEYFEALEANPDSRQEFFQVAVSIIETSKRMNKKADYEALLSWLLRISTKVESQAVKDEINKVVGELEEIKFGEPFAGATEN